MRQYSSCISLKFQIGIGIIINVDVFAIWGITLSSDFHILSISDLYIFLFNIWNHERSSYIFSCFVAAKVSPSAYRAPPSRGPPGNAIEVLSSFDSSWKLPVWRSEKWWKSQNQSMGKNLQNLRFQCFLVHAEILQNNKMRMEFCWKISGHI